MQFTSGAVIVTPSAFPQSRNGRCVTVWHQAAPANSCPLDLEGLSLEGQWAGLCCGALSLSCVFICDCSSFRESFAPWSHREHSHCYLILCVVLPSTPPPDSQLCPGFSGWGGPLLPQQCRPGLRTQFSSFQNLCAEIVECWKWRFNLIFPTSLPYVESKTAVLLDYRCVQGRIWCFNAFSLLVLSASLPLWGSLCAPDCALPLLLSPSPPPLSTFQI